MPAIQKTAKKLKLFVKPEAVTHRGMKIPAKHLRFGGSNFIDDEAFLSSGEKEAERLQTNFGLSRNMALLDLGCGPGRLPIGIISKIGEIRAYRGVDVSKTPVEWCNKHIGKDYPTFQFTHLDIKNERYNPSGSGSIGLPFPDSSFDIIYLYSVFSHMKTPDIEAYLNEFKRLLKPTGKVFLTAFVEDKVPEMEENPPNYKQDWKGALHCVRYEKNFFKKMIKGHGFNVDKLDYGTETDGQSGFYISSV